MVKGPRNEGTLEGFCKAISEGEIRMQRWVSRTKFLVKKILFPLEKYDKLRGVPVFLPSNRPLTVVGYNSDQYLHHPNLDSTPCKDSTLSLQRLFCGGESELVGLGARGEDLAWESHSHDLEHRSMDCLGGGWGGEEGVIQKQQGHTGYRGSGHSIPETIL